MNHQKTMVLLAATQLLLIIDTSIINVIVPTIATELRFSESGQSWIANAYLIAFGGALLLSGRVADLAGRVRVFQAGLLVLVVGSAVAALAFSPLALVVGRAIQGLGAALSAAASLALILATFRGHERERALGMLAAMAGLGGAAGTFLGGALTEWLGWRSTFWVNVIMGMLLLAASISILRPLKGKSEARAIDLSGAILLIAGQTLLAFGIVRLGETSDGQRDAVLALTGSLIALTLFFVHQRRAQAALIPNRTWKNTGLIAAAALAGTGQFVLFPMFFIANLYLQKALGYSPFASGIAFLPLCAVVVLTSSSIGIFIRKLGLDYTMAVGFAAVAIGLGWLSAMPIGGNFWTDVLGPTLIVGVGLPIIAITTNILGGQHAESGEEGLTSGLLNTAQQFGSVMGLSAMLSLAAFYTSHLETQADRTAIGALVGGYSLALMLACAIAIATAVLLAVKRERRIASGQPDV
ncbi:MULTISPECIES: MFS transporter [unclassified Ensifer]|uniref:MFS transporter n=1 Tax=unclassified Ensifer TaxID=2633371 RepID=UPI00300F84F1